PSGGRSEAGRAARGAPVAGAGGHLHRARRHGPLRRAVRRTVAGPRRAAEAATSESEEMIGFFRALLAAVRRYFSRRAAQKLLAEQLPKGLLPTPFRLALRVPVALHD